MQMNELTEQEQGLVLAHREQVEREKALMDRRLKLLRLAFEYEAWLQKEERGSTFSTFVNEFNYDEVDASSTYEAVQFIRGHAAGADS